MGTIIGVVEACAGVGAICVVCWRCRYLLRAVMLVR